MASDDRMIVQNARVPQADDRESSPRSLVGTAAAPVLFVPRLVLGMLADIRSIAEATRVIATLAESLASIEKGVEEMNREVHQMRAGVDALHPEVSSMRAAVEPLQDQLGAVRSLARIAARLPGGGGRAARRRDEEGADHEGVDLDATAEALEEVEPRT
jgi:hypothetical protein